MRALGNGTAKFGRLVLGHTAEAYVQSQCSGLSTREFGDTSYVIGNPTPRRQESRAKTEMDAPKL